MLFFSMSKHTDIIYIDAGSLPQEKAIIPKAAPLLRRDAA